MPIMVELATVALFLMDSSPVRRIKWTLSPIVYCVLALFAIMVLGLPGSLWPGKGFEFLTRDFIPTVILMVIIATSLRELLDLEWLAFAHLVGGVVYAFYIYLFCPIGWDGRLGALVFYDANDFALIMTCTIPFAVYFMRPGVVLWKRLFATGAVALFILMIIRSGSRGGFLGLIAVTAYVLLRYRAIPARLRIGAVGLGVLVFVVIGSATYWKIIGTIMHPADDYNMTSVTGRKAIWERGMGYMISHPVLGVGIRAFPQAEGMLSAIAKRYTETGHGLKWSVAHNSFVEIGAECGVIALALFLSILWLSFRSLARVRAGPRGSPVATPTDQAFAQMLTASLIGYIVSGIFVSAEYFTYLYVLLGLVLAQQAILRRRVRFGTSASRVSTGRPAAPRQRRVASVQWLPAGS